jgi:hypothetical protein
MAQLLLIKTETLRAGVNEVGDIVGIFSDEHKFSQAEKDGFTIKNVTGKVEEVKAELQKLYPAKPDLTINPKYMFKVSNDTATKISDMVTCKIPAKEAVMEP